MRSLRPCSDSSASPSVPSQPEGKIGLPRANPRGRLTSSKATLWVKAQHEGALPPPCIVRKEVIAAHGLWSLLERHPQLSLATRGEDWASQGQPKGKADLFQGDGRILRQAGVRVNRHQGCLSAGRSGETQPCGQPPVQKHGSKGLATQASLAPEVPCAQGGEQAVASPRLPRGRDR